MEEQQQEQELEEVVVEPSQAANPKKKPKRDRKDYMQLYYQKHKSPVVCSGCEREFACARSLKYHEGNNAHCLMRRLEGLWEVVRESFPEESGRMEPLMQGELRRVRKLISRSDGRESSREGSVEGRRKDVASPQQEEEERGG